MDRAPSYLSQSKAEAILSEVRPTKMKSEVLVCINVFLDEFLWLVLSTARSFQTDRLKMSLLKALPTSLGKAAILEAEVELKAYWEKTGIAAMKSLENSPSPSATDFPLQPAFEFLRHKCEAYSTLGDLDEDSETEARMQARMVKASTVPPNPLAVAPAALYLTAVLEHICEHLLGNVARVVARDSSRATAQVQDLNLALCEDESIYGLFSSMKVQEQIERQSKAPRPRRSKSFQRVDGQDPSRATSPQPMYANGSQRPSIDSNGTLLNPNYSDKRSNSAYSGSTKGTMVSFQEDGEDETGGLAFDDLMRSGTTMKVSLTPDRLKTFEVYNKHKQAKVPKPTTPTSTEPVTPFKSLRPVASSKSIGGPSDFQDDKDRPITPRARGHSIAIPAEAGSRRPSNSLTPQQPGSQMAPTQFPGPGSRRPATGDQMDPSSGMPKRNRPNRGPARNRESLDLDEVMDVEDEISFGPPPMVAKAAAPTGTSSSTRELIDFLSEGPPGSPSEPTTSYGNERPVKTTGRFRTIVSRLGRGGSNEGISANTVNGSSASLGRSNSQIRKQRSIGNLPAPSNNGSQTFPPPVYPRPPPPPVRTSDSTSPALPSPPAGADSSFQSPPRQSSVNRKAVPPWENANGQNRESTSSQQPSTTRTDSKSNLTSKPQTNGYPVPTISRESTAGPKRPSPPPAPKPAVIPTLPTVKAPDVAEMRKRLAAATSVPEARLLVDMFLAQWGFSASKMQEHPTPSVESVKARKEVSAAAVAGHGLIEVLLGDGHVEESYDQPEVVKTPEPVAEAPVITGVAITTATVATHAVATKLEVKGSTQSGSSSGGSSSRYYNRYQNVSPVTVGGN